MPITVNIRPEHNLTILTHRGDVPDTEFLDFYQRFCQDDTFDFSRNLLVDLRETNSSLRSTSALHQLAVFAREALGNHSRRPQIAIVAPATLTFGFARMYEAFADSVPWEFMAFSALDAALAWLGLPQDLLERVPPKPGQRHPQDR